MSSSHYDKYLSSPEFRVHVESMIISTRILKAVNGISCGNGFNYRAERYTMIAAMVRGKILNDSATTMMG